MTTGRYTFVSGRLNVWLPERQPAGGFPNRPVCRPAFTFHDAMTPEHMIVSRTCPGENTPAA